MIENKAEVRKVLQNLWQLIRFGIVGFFNTAIDFSVTNLLVWSLGVSRNNSAALFLISVAACAVATCNSYVMNARWTFRDDRGRPSRGAKGKFLLVSGVSLAVNTSTFLFFTQFLSARFFLPDLVLVNLARVMGVGAAFMVGFLGFRFGVFQAGPVKEFRTGFQFSEKEGSSFFQQTLALVSLAIFSRAAFLIAPASVTGEAAWRALAARRLWEGSNLSGGPLTDLFMLFQAPLHAVFSPIGAALVSSLVPGILLMIPVTWISRSLFGPRGGWLAGLFLALHPRLLEFSCNGQSESLFLLLLASGAAVMLPMTGKSRSMFAGAFLIGAATWVHWEGSWALLGLLGYSAFGKHARGSRIRRLASGAAAILSSTGCCLLVMVWLNGGRLALPALPGVGSISSSVLSAFQRLPGVLLTPAALLALLYPIFLGRRSLFRHGSGVVLSVGMPALAAAFFSGGEPGGLLPLLLPVNLFAAGGGLALAAYASRGGDGKRSIQVMAAVVLAFSILGGTWRAVDLSRRIRPYWEMAEYLRARPSVDIFCQKGVDVGALSLLVGRPVGGGSDSPCTLTTGSQPVLPGYMILHRSLSSSGSGLLLWEHRESSR